jgi:enoyl-CoA hydratase/carnithine racemase
MAAETWFTAQEAVEWGLADRIDESLKAAACISRDAAKLFGSVPDGIDIDDQPLIADTQEVEGTRQEPGLEDDGQEPAAALKAVALSSGRVVYLIRERKDE